MQYCGAPYLKYNGPPYKHLFVAAYETMAVESPYQGPEVEKHDKMVENEEHFH